MFLSEIVGVPSEPMGVWAAPTLAASVLLIATGSAKALRPSAGAPGLPFLESPRGAVAANLLVGVVEITVGFAGIAIGDRVVDAVTAALFVVFGLVTLIGLRSGVPSCGCVGRTDTPPTAAHVVMCVTFASVAAFAAIAGDRSSVLAVASRHSMAVDVGLIAGSFAVGWLAWTVLSLGRLAPQRTRRAASWSAS
jgi:hypothetical protein